MLAWLLAPPPQRRLLAGGGLRGAVPWIIAIMSFSMMIVAAAGLALANMASTVARSTESRFSIQVPAGTRNVDAVVKAVAAGPEVSNVKAVPESEMRKTLARWLGPQAAASSDLPVPALVNFDLRPGGDLAAADRRVKSVAPGAIVTAHRDNLKPLLQSVRLLQWLALGLVLLLTAATAAAVVLATRGALGTHGSTIEVMHGIGATDLQITRLFQRRIAIDAMVGSLAGGAAAGVALAMVLAGASVAGDLTGGAALGLGDLLTLLLLPVALTVLATWVARTAVLSALRQSL